MVNIGADGKKGKPVENINYLSSYWYRFLACDVMYIPWDSFADQLCPDQSHHHEQYLV